MNRFRSGSGNGAPGLRPAGAWRPGILSLDAGCSIFLALLFPRFADRSFPAIDFHSSKCIFKFTASERATGIESCLVSCSTCSVVVSYFYVDCAYPFELRGNSFCSLEPSSPIGSSDIHFVRNSSTSSSSSRIGLMILRVIVGRNSKPIRYRSFGPEPRRVKIWPART